MGKYVIVGASQGIGESIATALLTAGHEVINFSRNPSSINGVENHSWDALGADDSAIAAITGPVDGIAYCPGSINLKPFHRLTSADFEKDFPDQRVRCGSCNTSALTGIKTVYHFIDCPFQYRGRSNRHGLSRLDCER